MEPLFRIELPVTGVKHVEPTCNAEYLGQITSVPHLGLYGYLFMPS